MLTERSVLHRGDAEQVFQRELSYTRSMILKAPHNESSWNYLRGLCTSLGLAYKMSLEPSLSCLCLEVRLTTEVRSEFFSDTLQSVHLTMSDVQVLQQKSSCSLALGFLAELYIEQSRLSEAQKDQGRAAAAAALGTQCFSLLETTDPIRQSFWRQRRMDLMSKSSA